MNQAERAEGRKTDMTITEGSASNMKWVSRTVLLEFMDHLNLSLL
jgi:hypothetical protein